MTATGYRERDSSSFVLESNCSKAVHNQPHHAITTTESPLMYHKINSDIVLSDKLYYFDSSTKKWRLRTFRFDGRHLVCLRKTKYSGKKIPQKGNKVNPDLLTSIHCDTSSIDFEDEKHSKMYRSPQKSFCTSSEGKFSPNMLSPMFATPKSSWDMITAKDDDDKPGSSVPVLDAGYYQVNQNFFMLIFICSFQNL